MTMSWRTPHGDKLRALSENDKLPPQDRVRVQTAITKYEAWIDELDAMRSTGEAIIEPMVSSLSRYKTFIDLDFVFDSDENFLYRQKGQLKLDNTIVEEFLPRLVGRVFADQLVDSDLTLRPVTAFSQLRFDSDLANIVAGGGMAIRAKDQDFAMARPLFLKASHHRDFGDAFETKTHLAYVAAEIKTNLDKTMFQEAAATAHDLKLALPNSRYFLLCEWLDMTPISTSVTSIEEVIILRKAKRLPASLRQDFASAAGRAAARDQFERFLAERPFAPDAFKRFLYKVKPLLGNRIEDEGIALERGWF